MKVLQFPLTRITIAFVLGLLFAYYLHPRITIVFSILLVSFCVFSTVYYFNKNKSSLSFGIAVYLLSFIIGVSNQVIHTDYFQKNNYIHTAAVFKQPHIMSLTIREKLKNSDFSDRYTAVINRIDKKEQTGKIIINIQKDSSHLNLIPGTALLVKGILVKNKPPTNPSQFDYDKYLKNKQIYSQLYANPKDIKIGNKIQKSVWYYAFKVRTRIITNLEKNHFNKTELNVAVALIMGQQQDIAPEIIKDYQYAGAVHILSVSGLHVGFILLFVTFILKPIPNTKKGSLIKLIVILVCLWLFGILAGLAPSVVRSVTMFSFVAIGNHLRRGVNIYHTLLVSVLLILLVQPSFLFDIGFQLSYIALFFILWLQPLLANLWLPKNKFLKYIWSVLTVSFAAQIGTLPLSIYYFHQFPGLFFITNLIIIPLLSGIMVIGVLVMVLAALNTIPVFISKLLEWSIYYLNKIINAIASLEQFIIHDIPLHFYFLLSSYFALFTLIYWLKKPSFNAFVLVLLSIISIQGCYFKTYWDNKNEQELIVFHSKKNSLIAVKKEGKITVYANKNTLEKLSQNTILKSYLIGNSTTIYEKTKLQNFIYFNKKKVFILDSTRIYLKDSNPDVVLLTQSSKINLDRLLMTVKPKIVLADGSNFKNLQKLWQKSCKKNKIPFHSTSEKGFYTMK